MNVAIMQPTYMPWAGYFHLMKNVDVFIFLTDVPMAQQRPNWQRENRVFLPKEGLRWLRVPVHRINGPDTLLKDVRIKDEAWRDKQSALIRKFESLPNFSDYGEPILSILSDDHSGLCDLNIKIIEFIAKKLEIDCTFLRSDLLTNETFSKEDKIINLCKISQASTYFSPLGARGYCTESKFAAEDIELRFQKYEPVAYFQGTSSFVSHLSILDFLLREPENASHLFNGANQNFFTPDEASALVK